MAALGWAVGEFSEVLKYEHLQEPAFMVSYGINVSLGMLLVYSTFLCTNVTSPLTWGKKLFELCLRVS